MEIQINGKTVTLRDKIPVKEGRYIRKTLTAIDDDDLLSQVPLMQFLVESWEFPGDPKDAESYGDLDTIREFIPLSKAIAEMFTDQETSQKN